MGGWYNDAPETPGQILQAENLSRQYEFAIRQIERAVNGDSVALDRAFILELHRLAMAGMIEDAGSFRVKDVEIRGSRHDPPRTSEVDGYVVALCEEINASEAPAIEQAAMVMWRLNWIHPFSDGNGRVARAAAFVVLFARIKILPSAKAGRMTFLDRLSTIRKHDYVDALEAADRAASDEVADVSMLADLLSELIREEFDEDRPM